MNVEITLLSFENPVFQTYVIAACIMILKLMLQPWMTVVRMTKVRGGFRSPEDLKKTPLNPNPEPSQLEINEYVDRSRRLNLNDLESIPAFLVAGFLFVLTGPSLLHAQILIWTYVASRAAHFVAYVTAQIHDVRAFCWTWSSLSVIAMVIHTLAQALYAREFLRFATVRFWPIAAIGLTGFRASEWPLVAKADIRSN